MKDKELRELVNENYKPRLIDKTIEEYLNVAKAVCVEGPKWCGKTWASAFHSKSEFLLAKPDHNFQNRLLASLDPVSILEGEQPRLIDEWQEVPSIWDAVKFTSDKSIQKGQFILTGSSTPKNKGIMHSGAGRIAKIRMHTMSLYESNDSNGLVSLETICNNEPIELKIVEEVPLKKIAYFICRGGWPENINSNIDNCTIMPKSYIESIITDDIQRLDDDVKYEIPKLRLLLRSLARNESTTCSNSVLSKDISKMDNKTLSEDSISKYLSAFDRLFLLNNQEPFSPNIRSSLRVKQMEKRHFCDPAVACSILDITPNKLLNDLETFGFMFEGLVERDLSIYAEAINAKLYHYQDYKQNEIDACIELENGDWAAIEIKLGASQIDKAASNLIKIAKLIEEEGGKSPKSLIVIVALSNAIYKRPDGVYVVPITALKN